MLALVRRLLRAWLMGIRIFVVTLCLAGCGSQSPGAVDGSLPLGTAGARCPRSDCPVPRALTPGSGFPLFVLDESHASLTAESSNGSVASVGGASRFEGCCTSADSDGRCVDWLPPDPLTGMTPSCDGVGTTHYVYSYSLDGLAVGQADIVFRDSGRQIYDLPIAVEDPTRFQVTFGSGPDPETLPTVSSLDLVIGPDQLLALAFFDAAGTPVFGESPTMMKLLDPSVAAFAGDGADPAQWWASRIAVRPLSPGRTTLVVDAAGQHAELPVSVAP